MTKYWLTIGAVSLLLAGCAESTPESQEQEAATQGEVNSAEAGATPAAETVEFSVTGEADATANKQEAQVAPAAEVKLNPPHGQPGHDCAIAVGAPLDGSAPQAQPQQTQQQQLPTLPKLSQPIPQQPAQTAAPKDGINPPHGQPGHDCAVAVGAPLPKK